MLKILRKIKIWSPSWLTKIKEYGREKTDPVELGTNIYYLCSKARDDEPVYFSNLKVSLVLTV